MVYHNPDSVCYIEIGTVLKTKFYYFMIYVNNYMIFPFKVLELSSCCSAFPFCF